MIDPDLITTIRVGELPSLNFSLTDLIPHESGTDLKSGTVQQLLDLLRPLVGKLQYEIVELDVNAQYVIDNFDETGLGTNLCLGFAICNGQNGTKNRDGRSSIAYGSSYNSVGVLGGFTDSTLVAHNHNTITRTGTVIPHISSLSFYNQGETWSASGNVNEKDSGISNSGISGTNRNYHPYIVTLTMMKL